MAETVPLKKGRIPKGLKKVRFELYYDASRDIYWKKNKKTLYAYKLKEVGY